MILVLGTTLGGPKCFTLFIQYVCKNCPHKLVNVMTENGFFFNRFYSNFIFHCSLFAFRFLLCCIRNCFCVSTVLLVQPANSSFFFRNSLARLSVIIVTPHSSFVYICRKDEWRVTQKMTFLLCSVLFWFAFQHKA